MNAIDIAVIAAVAVIAILIIRDVIKKRKAGVTSCGCGGGCSGCPSCGGHPHNEEEE